jgi:hypothetical protein
MLHALINDAKSAVAALVAKYLTRAYVALPFLVALGFATAATTLTLIERFGAIAAYWIVAGGFILIGLGATVAVAVKEHEAEIVGKEADVTDTAEIVTDAAAAAAQKPLELLDAILATRVGPSTIAGAANVVTRNVPLVVLLALIALLFWPSESAEEQDAKAREDVDGTNGSWPAPNGFRRETAV